MKNICKKFVIITFFDFFVSLPELKILYEFLPQGKLTELKSSIRLYRGTTAREVWSGCKEARLNFPCGRASIQPQVFLQRHDLNRKYFSLAVISLKNFSFLAQSRGLS
jgi:hypothetical protein